jgi:hypothetical protein
MGTVMKVVWVLIDPDISVTVVTPRIVVNIDVVINDVSVSKMLDVEVSVDKSVIVVEKSSVIV